MRCYLVQGGGRKRYAGTNADASAVRNTIVEEMGVKKKDVDIVQVDISLAKHELLEFINKLCSLGDKDDL
jgi:hypothetical protein